MGRAEPHAAARDPSGRGVSAAGRGAVPTGFLAARGPPLPGGC